MKRALVALIGTLTMSLALTGCGSSEPSEREYIEGAQIQEAFNSPNQYKGKYVDILGEVFSKVGSENGRTVYQACYNHAIYDGIFTFEVDSSAGINICNPVVVNGRITGEFMGKDALGGTVRSLGIEADSVDVVCVDPATPTFEEVVPADAIIDQHGFVLKVNRVEFDENETRIYMTETNNTDAKFSLWTHSMTIVQNGQQVEQNSSSPSPYEGDFVKLPGDLVPGATASGIAIFPLLDGDAEFQLTVEGSSSNHELDFAPFTFTITPAEA